MALVNIEDVRVLNNPAPFTSDFHFRITFDCVAPGIKDELEWKLIYVGNAEDEKQDQTLDSVLVGPIAVGKNEFDFITGPPDPAKIKKEDLAEVTVVLLTCSYHDQEFIRVGYYVNNGLDDENTNVQQLKPQEDLTVEEREKEIEKAQMEKNKLIASLTNEQVAKRLTRTILSDKPRVTRFAIPEWQPKNDDEVVEMENSNQGDMQHDINDDEEEFDVDQEDDDDDDEEEDDGFDPEFDGMED